MSGKSNESQIANNMAECRLLTWQRIQHENNMTNTALQKYMPNSIRKIACQNVILSIWKTLQQIQLDKCITAKSESNTWQKRQHGKNISTTNTS